MIKRINYKIRYKFIFTLIVTIFLILGIALGSKSEPIITITTNYYEISGKTAAEIGKSLYENSPIIQNGKKYHAYTKWYVKWNFYWQKSPNSCQITSFKTSLDVEYTLPKLISYAYLSPSVKQKWDKYYQALIKHEQNHKNFGLNAVRDIEKYLLNMNKREKCTQLEKEVNQMGYKIINQYAEQEKKYDRITNYGVKEGAVFP